MATPIIEQIAAELAQTLAEVTVGRGNQQTLSVERYDKTRGNSPVHLLAVLAFGDAERDEESAPIGSYGWDQEFIVTVYYSQDNDTDETTASDTELQKIAADIYKKLEEDHSRNNLAVDTTPLVPEMGESGEGFSSIMVKFNVRYRVPFDNPYIAF